MGSVFDNGGFLNLSRYPSLLDDDFENFSEWVTVGSGSVIQNSTYSYEGTFSALKTTAADPNGAYKLLKEPVSRDFVLSVWINRTNIISGGADRLAIIDQNANGYGFIIQGASIGIERRTNYAAGTISSQAYTRTNGAWYLIIFEANSDNTFTISSYDTNFSLLATMTSASDTTHTGSFDRIAILGGYEYAVDNLKIIKKNYGGIYNLNSAYESRR